MLITINIYFLFFCSFFNISTSNSNIFHQNLNKLNVEILEPESGYLACGYEGKGRLCSLDKIFDKTVEILNCKKLNGKKIVITSGGTIEEIDPVRYISNYSSGKMGLALADTAKNLGADVTLITTCDVIRKYNVVKVKSAQEMQTAVEKEFGTATCIIMAAAVADYRVKERFSQKMKKTSGNEITLTLVKNPDILLCDEPTGALDYKTSKDILKLIEKHDVLSVIMKYAGKVDSILSTNDKK